MKKIIYSVLALLLLTSPAFAMDKAKVKIGPIKFNSKNKGEVTGISVTPTENSFDVLITGLGKKSGNVLSLEIPNTTEFEKGTLMSTFSTVGQVGEGGTGDVGVAFGIEKNKKKFASTYNDSVNTVTEGTVKVKSYNPETGVLKLNINAVATPIENTKVSKEEIEEEEGETSETSEMDVELKIKAQVVITLPVEDDSEEDESGDQE